MHATSSTASLVALAAAAAAAVAIVSAAAVSYPRPVAAMTALVAGSAVVAAITQTSKRLKLSSSDSSFGPMGKEARLAAPSQYVLISLSSSDIPTELTNFYGSVITLDNTIEQVCIGTTTHILKLKTIPDLIGKEVYVCGDVASMTRIETVGCGSNTLATYLQQPSVRARVICELSTGVVDSVPEWETVSLGQVPLDVHGVGILFPRFFDRSHGEFFDRINSEHEFQSLTESTKPGTAMRTGIYMTPVVKQEDELKFRLLRCSSNFSGPTVNFRATDRHIVNALNNEAGRLFEDAAPLNHVLAQIYHNTPAAPGQKQKKAKIKAHSDKTKDMPENAVMAFVTFYSGLEKLKPLKGVTEDPWDWGHKKTSGLTRLCFRLKPCVAKRPDCNLTSEFSVWLYPNSVFFMSLSTNRLYTHEIRPSTLNASMLPTRMGYVVRCSDTHATHRDDETFIQKRSTGEFVPLSAPTREGMEKLRAMYAEQNSTEKYITYADKFMFSMNKGDYMAPVYSSEDEFPVYTVPIDSLNPFDDLLTSVDFEPVIKGRQGAVLVHPDPVRGIPVVRTASKMVSPAQCFKPIHTCLARKLEEAASLPMKLNNALIEVYSNEYYKMGYHSDMALDLQENSYVAVFSCYEDPDVAHLHPRKLVVESKSPDNSTFEVKLEHNTVVVFSMNTNGRFRHKIVLDSAADAPANRWLGVTFRTSKSFVTVDETESETRFEDGTRLLLATVEQRKQFYTLRSRENKEICFIYPPLTITVSPSDLISPATCK